PGFSRVDAEGLGENVCVLLKVGHLLISFTLLRFALLHFALLRFVWPRFILLGCALRFQTIAPPSTPMIWPVT
ncbi:MAG: hypothetical protein LBH21_06170, partial [Gracilibacteraceae bacterium]|nr:hypothetical protein [Gracilibacteraceae bacterium]